MLHSLRFIASVTALVVLSNGCDKKGDASAKDQPKAEEKAPEKPQKPTELKVESTVIEKEFTGDYEVALASYSLSGFKVVFMKDCEDFKCDSLGYLQFGGLKQICPNGVSAEFKLSDKENVVPEPGDYEAKVDFTAYKRAGNNNIEPSKKNKVVLTASSKTEVTGTIDIEGDKGAKAKGRFKAKVCPHG